MVVHKSDFLNLITPTVQRGHLYSHAGSIHAGQLQIGDLHARRNFIPIGTTGMIRAAVPLMAAATIPALTIGLGSSHSICCIDWGESRLEQSHKPGCIGTRFS